jgi:hypothetical protein
MDIQRALALCFLFVAFSSAAQERQEDTPSNTPVNGAEDNAQLQPDELRAKDEEIKRLRKLISELDRSSINMAAMIDERITETTATFVFKTNAFGRVVVLISGKNGFEKTQESNDREHIVGFSGLMPGETYKLSFYAITPSGKRRLVQSDKDVFTTQPEGSDDKPIVNIQNTPKIITPNSITLELFSDKKVQIEIYCKKRVDGLASPAPCPQFRHGEIRLTKAGRHLDDAKKYEGVGEFLISGLEPDSVYEFSGTAVGENGIKSDLIFLRTYRTAKAPNKVDFSGPVNFEIRPDQTLVSWKWTSEPSRSTVILKIGERSVQFEPPKMDLETQMSTAAVPLAKIMDALGGDNKSKPIVLVEMQDGGDQKVSREFSFALVIPKPQPGMNAEQKDAIEQATRVIGQRRGKLNWTTIRQIGLPILLSLLPP